MIFVRNDEMVKSATVNDFLYTNTLLHVLLVVMVMLQLHMLAVLTQRPKYMNLKEFTKYFNTNTHT